MTLARLCIALVAVVTCAAAERVLLTLNGSPLPPDGITVNASDLQLFECVATDSAAVANVSWLLGGADVTASAATYVGVAVAGGNNATTLEPRQTLRLRCVADANPPPTYAWYRGGARLPDRGAAFSRAAVTYAVAGDYYCEASNAVARRRSPLVRVRVDGAPSFAEPSAERTARLDHDVRMAASFCSRPRYHTAYWEWDGGDGLIDLTTAADGSVGGRFKAEIVVDGNSGGGCYRAELLVLQARESDIRVYTFVVNNGGGDARFDVTVRVRAGISSPAVLVPIFGGLALILCVLGVIAYVRKIWCFRLRDEAPLEADEEEGRLTELEASVEASVAATATEKRKTGGASGTAPIELQTFCDVGPSSVA